MSRRLWRLLALPATSAVLTVAAIPAAVSGATTLNVPGSFATIQAAIDASAPGDTDPEFIEKAAQESRPPCPA